MALVGDGDENGKAETAVMVYLDDGCTPDNAVSEMVANKLVELSDGATIKKVDEYQVELAAVEDEPTLLDTVLVIKRLRIKVGSKTTTLNNLEFNILPGHGPELILGRRTLTSKESDGLHLTSMRDQLCEKHGSLATRTATSKKVCRAAKKIQEFEQLTGAKSCLTLEEAESDDDEMPGLAPIDSDSVSDSDSGTDDEEKNTKKTLCRKSVTEPPEGAQVDASLGSDSSHGELGGVPVAQAEQRRDGNASLSVAAFHALATVASFDNPQPRDKYNVITERALNTLSSDDFEEVNDAPVTEMSPTLARVLNLHSNDGKNLTMLHRAVKFKHVWYTDNDAQQSQFVNLVAYVVDDAHAAVLVLGSETRHERDEQQRAPKIRATSWSHAEMEADRATTKLGLEKVMAQAKRNGAPREFLQQAEELLFNSMVDVFRSDFGGDPPCNAPPLVLELKDDAPTSWKDHYRKYSIVQRDAMKVDLDVLLKAGFIRKSTSPFIGSVVMTKKLSGGWRLAVDLRKANTWLVDRFYLMPHVAELIQRLGQCYCFCKMDVAKGFWNVRVAEEGRKYFGFATPFGTYEW